jgi:hypothetical protein
LVDIFDDQTDSWRRHTRAALLIAIQVLAYAQAFRKGSAAGVVMCLAGEIAYDLANHELVMQ